MDSATSERVSPGGRFVLLVHDADHRPLAEVWRGMRPGELPPQATPAPRDPACWCLPEAHVAGVPCHLRLWFEDGRLFELCVEPMIRNWADRPGMAEQERIDETRAWWARSFGEAARADGAVEAWALDPHARLPYLMLTLDPSARAYRARLPRPSPLARLASAVGRRLGLGGRRP